MYHRSVGAGPSPVSMRPKKSPAPGERRSSSASSTVTSTYSAVNSSAALCGSTRSSRSIIRSRDARANASRSRSTASSGNGSTPDTGGGDATPARRGRSGFLAAELG